MPGRAAASETEWRNEALWYRRFGRPADVLRLEGAGLAQPAPGAMRVRMMAAPINPSDLIPIEGAYRQRLSPPRVAGYEGVGTVVEAPAAARNLLGRRVLPLRGPGTWQRYVDCDPALAVPVPEDIGAPLAARAYINPLAALLMLRSWPVSGKRVLLTAAGSSCADLLAQWALEAGASEVVGVYRSPQRRRTLEALGVRPLALGRRAALTEAMQCADLVFDAVGGPLAESLLAGMRPDAVFVSYGLLSGAGFAVPAGAPAPHRFHLRDRLAEAGPVLWQDWFRELWPLLRRAVMPGVDAFPLADWRRALARFDTPGRAAKPLLELA
ncbi:MAG: zinc-dependent alcohol dehydrogenase family protein [Acidihalobacter sp.]